MTPTATPVLPRPVAAPPTAAPSPPAPPAGPTPPRAAPFVFQTPVTLRPFTVAEYDKMIEAGILGKYDRVELLEGYVVLKMARNPPHDGSLSMLDDLLGRLLPPPWGVRCQVGTKLVESRPEPDLAVVRGPLRTYFTRHPGPADLALVVEVADSSLAFDQRDKFRIYARDLIPVYWIVNLIDRRVEVYTDPTGPGDDPRYHSLRVFPAGAAVPVELDGVTVGAVPVDELLP